MTVLDKLANEEYIKWQRSEPDKMAVILAWSERDDNMASKIDNLFGSMRWVLPEQKIAILKLQRGAWIH